LRRRTPLQSAGIRFKITFNLSPLSWTGFYACNGYFLSYMKLKQLPTDFIVEEIPNIRVTQEKDDQTIFLLEKKEIDTYNPHPAGTFFPKIIFRKMVFCKT
jgi:hypothetical protein